MSGCEEGLLTSAYSPARYENIHKVPLFGVCGQTNISCRVVKGKVVEEGKWPWQVSILFLGVYICSGSIFHEQWVLTAAHCLQRSRNASQYSVRVGHRSSPETDIQLPINHIVIHKSFNNLASQDIALLKLQNTISWSPNIQPICLPDAQYKPLLGSICWVIGWGQVGKQVTSTSAPYSLQEIAIKIIHNDICNQRYRFLLKRGEKFFIGNDMLCGISQRAVTSCQGNSGNPLICQVNKTWIQVGLVSWGFSCGRSRLPSIYTSTSHFTQWIKNQVSDVKFFSRASPAFWSPVFLTGYILLVSLGSLWLL
ncbi:serine protease 46 [Trichechus manatus latirostris]|uniref:Serine protease 46 n=1 Tax=Trichechus manatus latirostris TaxID=127582 RepID=A0A2Y9D6N1_TRIMA|nr:serine protease 46 [Trichechus manatus latirostris]